MHLIGNMIKFITFQISPLVAMLLLCFGSLFVGNIYLIISFLLILPYLLKYCGFIRYNVVLRRFFYCVLIGSILNLPFTQNGIGGTLNFIVAIGLMIYAVNNLRITGYAALLLCFYTIFFSFYNIFVLGTDLNLIYEAAGLSKNYPGYVMVMCCCVWGYSKYIRKQEIPLLLPLICTFIAFFLDGRSSLGILALISVFCLLFKFRRYYYISIAIGVAILFFVWDDLLFYFSFSNLSESGFSSSRYLIWKSYFSNLDLFSFIFGLDTLNVPVLRDYGGNPHNAFLNYHYRMGLLGVGALLYIIIYSIKVLLKEKSYKLLFFELALIARIFFDACIGGGHDFFFFTMFFYPILFRKNVHQLQFSPKNNKINRPKAKNPIIRFVKPICEVVEKYI